MVACDHTSAPSDYLQWHDWAERKSRTHEQRRCPDCGLWAVWVPKTTVATLNPKEGQQ